MAIWSDLLSASQRLAIGSSCALLACAPQTDLLGEGSNPPGSDTASEAAGAVLVDPMPGAGGVPLNLAALVVRFPGTGPVSLSADALIVTASGHAVEPQAPTVAACPGEEAGGCFRAALGEPLMPSLTYRVALGSGVLDGAGHQIAAGPIGEFQTAAEADLVPPVISSFTVEPMGPCILASFQTDESAAGTLLIRGPGFERSVSAGAGTTRFLLATSLLSIPVGVGGGGAANGAADLQTSPTSQTSQTFQILQSLQVLQILARAVDLAGNLAETAAVSVTVPPDLLPLAITEVHANPAGPEPAQEYVELRNLGAAPIDIGNLIIEDSKGADVLPSLLPSSAALDPGAYALVVPAGFDEQSALDVRPRAGTPLIRVDARIGSDGLSNAGEVVRLRTTDGTVVSSYGGFVDVSAAKWSGKSVHRVPEDACDQAASWTHLPTAATPGAPKPD